MIEYVSYMRHFGGYFLALPFISSDTKCRRASVVEEMDIKHSNRFVVCMFLVVRMRRLYWLKRAIARVDEQASNSEKLIKCCRGECGEQWLGLSEGVRASETLSNGDGAADGQT